MRWQKLQLVLSQSLGVISVALGSRCSSVAFQVPVTVENAVWLAPPDLSSEESVIDFFKAGLVNGTGGETIGTETVSGTYTIKGRYCSPAVENQRKALQILVHGIGYTKSIWSGWGFGVEYDWQEFAAAAGYSTLAIDRLGHGDNPTRPDSLAVVQGSMHVETLHQIIDSVRTKSNNPLGRIFSNVALVTHSYGSWVATGLVTRYPRDVDSIVLTGYSTAPDLALFAAADLRSAAAFDPVRFAGHDLGYILWGRQSEQEAAFWAGRYDEAIASYDFAHQDTWTVGETGTLDFASTVPASYEGSVFLITGVQDAIFCRTPMAACESLLGSASALFPNARNFSYSAVESTGHNLMVHESAPVTFAKAHDFLSHNLVEG